MDSDLFGAVPECQPTTPGRGPKGGKHYTKPRGYAGTPGTGPEGMRCRDCLHYVTVEGNNKTYPKCGKTRPNWTHGRGSDILARSPCCQYFEVSHD